MITKIENPNFSHGCFACGNRLFKVGATIITQVGGNGQTIYFHPACANDMGTRLKIDYREYFESEHQARGPKPAPVLDRNK